MDFKPNLEPIENANCPDLGHMHHTAQGLKSGRKHLLKGKLGIRTLSPKKQEMHDNSGQAKQCPSNSTCLGFQVLQKLYNLELMM